MKLELYYFDSCPFCARVLSFLKGKEHSIEFKNTMQKREYFEELKKRNHGKKQVPCLFIDGKPMLESLDIIRFLEKKL